MKRFHLAWALVGLAVAGVCLATEIETTGEPGSPGATTTISSKQLPPPTRPSAA